MSNPLSSNRILVVGGAGYIGSFTVEALRKGGVAVSVLDDLSTGHRQALHPDVPFYQGSIENSADIDYALAQEKPCAVIHFAALASVPESMAKPFLYFQHNITWTLNLLERMLAHGITKIVFSSSAATYGVPSELLSEDHPQLPINPYGASKLSVENILRALSESGKFHAAALRYFNACGAALDGTRGEDHTPESHLIPNAVSAALGLTPPMTIFGNDYPTPDGTCVRDFIHVEDLASAHIAALSALESDAQSGHFPFRAYNVGSGDGYSIAQVLAAVARITGKEVPFTYGARRAGDPATLVAICSRIKSELGWAPKHSAIDEIVESVVKWKMGHPKGY